MAISNWKPETKRYFKKSEMTKIHWSTFHRLLSSSMKLERATGNFKTWAVNLKNRTLIIATESLNDTKLKGFRIK